MQGHVDCAARVLSISQSGLTYRVKIALPLDSAKYVVSKGSIAVNGVSLTVAEVERESFVVWIIPHTFAHTNFCLIEAASLLNLEFDLLAKYVERLVSPIV